MPSRSRFPVAILRSGATGRSQAITAAANDSKPHQFAGIAAEMIGAGRRLQVTTGRLMTLLNDIGIEISKWQVVRLLAKELNGFVAEDAAMPHAGPVSATYITRRQRRNVVRRQQKQTTGRNLHLFEPQECANYFKAAGYDPD